MNCSTCGGVHFGSYRCPYIESPCSVCGEATVFACADCGIHYGGAKSIHVCNKFACRDKHEQTDCKARP